MNILKPTVLSILFLLFTIILISCGDDNPSSPAPDANDPNIVSEDIGSTGGNITSKDQRLTLTIPAGALGNTEAITIKEISENDLGSEFDQVISVIGLNKVYELGPDGLTFSSPITVSFQSDQIPTENADSFGAHAEFMFTSSGGNVELLSNLRTEGNFDEGKITVQGELQHFSPLATSQANNGVSFFVFGVPESMNVGDTFTANAQIHESAAGPLGDIVSITGQAKYEDKSGSPIEPTFNPTTADIPGNSDDGYSGNYEYTCTAPGIGVYRSELSARVRFDLDSGPVFATSYAPYVTTITCEEPPVNTFTLTVEKEGNGVVKNESGEINCGDNCSADFAEDAMVTLMAEPEEGWVFDGWSGDIPAECDESLDDCTVTMDQARNVTAHFVEEIFSLVFEGLLVCVEHGETESDILFLFDLAEREGEELYIELIVIDEEGDEDIVILDSYDEARAFFRYGIYEYGDYIWFINYVEIDGVEVDFEGVIEGVVEVDSNEQNPGECKLE